jgi:hypothetical protein
MAESEKTSGGGCATAALITVGMLVGFAYSVYTLWSVAGFWRITAVFFLSLVGGFLIRAKLGGMTVSRSAEGVKYDPKEWPVLVDVVFQGSLAAYMTWVFASKTLTTWELAVAIFFVGICNVLPLLYRLYRTLRDRNDFVLLGEQELSWRDNDATGRLAFADVTDLKLDAGGLRVVLGEAGEKTVPVDAMNFDTVMQLQLLMAVTERIPAAVREALRARAG